MPITLKTTNADPATDSSPLNSCNTNTCIRNAKTISKLLTKLMTVALSIFEARVVATIAKKPKMLIAIIAPHVWLGISQKSWDKIVFGSYRLQTGTEKSSPIPP